MKKSLLEIPGYGSLMRAGDMPLPSAKEGLGLGQREASLMYRYLMERLYGGGVENPIQIPQQYAEAANAMVRNPDYDEHDPLSALFDDPFTDKARQLIDEPFANEAHMNYANLAYDENQPYGFDFRSLIDGVSDFDGKYSTPGAMEAVSGDGEIIPAIENPQLPAPVDDDPLKGTVAQLLKTGGSMALPMLFSMLMRGGK